MAPKSTAIEISAICGLFILLALWGIVWDITSGLLTSGIDGIMLALRLRDDGGDFLSDYADGVDEIGNSADACVFAASA